MVAGSGGGGGIPRGRRLGHGGPCASRPADAPSLGARAAAGCGRFPRLDRRILREDSTVARPEVLPAPRRALRAHRAVIARWRPMAPDGACDGPLQVMY